MKTKIQCFFLEATELSRRALRRYSSDLDLGCSSGWYHNAQSELIDVVPSSTPDASADWPRDDSRWPARCACGYAFTPEDQWQVFGERVYARRDTGEEMTLRDAPVGALWWATWLDEAARGGHFLGAQLEHTLVVRTPGGEWMPDMRSSNCTLPSDNEHHCWVLHGTVPNVTVDKNGRTCRAGGGSIVAGKYHGFLRNGFLEEC